MKTTIRPTPCRFCPYRRDVPSGVWHESEYAKLERYDADTASQLMAGFLCHEARGSLCCGWAQCHGDELLALRVARSASGQPIPVPSVTVPIFTSGAEAAKHGRRDIERPKVAARRAMAILSLKQSRQR